MTALLPADDALSRRRSLTLPALRGLLFILFQSGFAFNRIMLDACKAYGFEPDVAARSSQIDFIVELAAAGMGVGFLPRMIAQERKHPSVKCVPLLEARTDWHIAMIWRRGAYLRAWLDLVGDAHSRPQRAE